MNAEILEEIKSLCLPFYNSLDFAHGPLHGERVAAFAIELQRHEGGDRFLIEAGACLHQYHDRPAELDELLNKIDLNPESKSFLKEIVRLCRPHLISLQAPLEAQIVFDADALDLMGPTGILREVLCNAVARGQSPEEAIENARAVQELFRDRLNTQTARRFATLPHDPSVEFWASFLRWQSPEKVFSMG